MQHVNVTMAQINTKRHWRFAGARMKNMLSYAAKRGATILTLNEISKEQVEAIKATPGWDVHHTVNDKLPGGGYAGNAVAWKTSEWEINRRWTSPIEINYRPGTFRRGFGRPFKKTIRQACVTLRSKRVDGWPVVVMAFHNPTVQNSANNSREKSVGRLEKVTKRLLAKGVNVILGGDGNNIFPKVKGLHDGRREGPDKTFSTGQSVKHRVLRFKLMGQSDHNGILSTFRFGAKEFK